MSCRLSAPDEIVFARGVWLPRATRRGERLHLDIVGGADANHDPRSFAIPCEDRHVEAMRASLPRHVLLACALLPLCERAGSTGDLPSQAAKSLLDPVLCGTDAQADAHLRRAKPSLDALIAYGADLDDLERGQYVRAMRDGTAEADWARADEVRADRQRRARGIVLTELDAAVLRFTGRYAHGTTLPRRLPDTVNAEQLPRVLELVAAAEDACAGMRVGYDTTGPFPRAKEKDVQRIRAAVERRVERLSPGLADDAVSALAALMTHEASARDRPRR